MIGDLYVFVATCWEWVLGLRISTEEQRARQAMDLAMAEARAVANQRAAEQANAEKREAQRILAIVTEPLKDWELADFPDPGYLRRRSEKPGHTTPLGYQDVAHLANVLEAYRTVARDAAQARMSVTTNDMLRGRTWADEPRAVSEGGGGGHPIRRTLP